MTDPAKPAATPAAPRPGGRFPWKWILFGAAAALAVLAIQVMVGLGSTPPPPMPMPLPSAPATPAPPVAKPATSAPAPAPAAPAAPAIGVEHDLFPASGLAGWEMEMGSWSNRAGVISGRGDPSLNARMFSKQAYRDFVLTCRMRLIGKGGGAEIQVHGHDQVIGITWDAPETWQELRVEVRAGVATATCDGKPLAVEAEAAKSGHGPLGFLVRREGRLEIGNARITELAAP